MGIGDDYGKAAVKAVELLGGIKRFVPKGAKVALLPNVQSRHPGSFTKPEILRAVIRLCKKAGASEVNCLSWQTAKQWEDTGLKAVIDAEGAGLKLFEKDESLFKPVPVPDGVVLKEARILAALYDHDLLINMPITKDHAGNKFTGTMKNLMGLNSPESNRTFHRPNWKTDPDDVAHLDQSIVDLNKAVRPALNVVDATEFIVSNGPFGPGQLFRPQQGRRRHRPRRHRRLLRRALGPQARGHRPDQARRGAGARPDQSGQGRPQRRRHLTAPDAGRGGRSYGRSPADGAPQRPWPSFCLAGASAAPVRGRPGGPLGLSSRPTAPPRAGRRTASRRNSPGRTSTPTSTAGPRSIRNTASAGSSFRTTRTRSGKSVSLEIFEMETPAAAYGIFTLQEVRQGEERPSRRPGPSSRTII